MLRETTTALAFESRGIGLGEITEDVGSWIASLGINESPLTLFVRRISASLRIQENADPGVRGDLGRFFARLVPYGDALVHH